MAECHHKKQTATPAAAPKTSVAKDPKTPEVANLVVMAAPMDEKAGAAVPVVVPVVGAAVRVPGTVVPKPVVVVVAGRVAVVVEPEDVPEAEVVEDVPAIENAPLSA